jgi:hypothetical protein
MIKNMPKAIIKIPEGKQDFYNQKPVFEVLIKQDNKIIYHNKTYAVVMNMVQSITKLDLQTGDLEGDSQVLGIGHPIVQFFALDQLKMKMRKTGIINQAMIMINKLIKNPELKKQMLEIMKKVSIK